MADTNHTVTFGGLNLICRDVEATLDFYRLLGVDIPEQAVWGTESGIHHVSRLDVDGRDAEVLEFDSVTLAQHWDAGTVEFPTDTVIGFSVATRDAVDEVHGRLTAAGHPSRHDPYDAFWGARYAVVADPDGRHVGIMSPMDPAMRHEGPDLA
jgi:catechol 2,3-dioxygenase-like lactoylglutathione lyase family enzyme